MNAMRWVQGVLVTVGLSFGGSALAAGPGPAPAAKIAFHGDKDDDGVFERRYQGRDRDDRWQDGWADERGGHFDRRELRLLRNGKQKIQSGKALQARGEMMLVRARRLHSFRLARQAHGLIARGESLEREGRALVRKARGYDIAVVW